MASDHSMLSDGEDEVPLASQSTQGAGAGKNGHVAQHASYYGNGNGHARRDADDSPMSEDEDIPLSQVSRTKSEPMTPEVRSLKRKKQAAYSSSDEDAPLASSPPKHRRSAAVPMPGARKATTVPAAMVNGNGKLKHPSADSSESDSPPLSSQVASTSKASAKPRASVKRKVEKEESEEEFLAESEDDKPAPTPAPPKKKRKVKDESDEEAAPPAKKKRALKKPKEEAGSETEVPPPKKRSRAKKEPEEEDGGDAKDAKPAKKGRGKKAKDEGGEDEKPGKKGKGKKVKDEEAEDVYRWWEQDGDQTVTGDGIQKWTTLEHNGVIFPLPYQPLPTHVKMKYNGQPVDLPPASEEVAGFYAAMIETDHAKDSTFNKNFFQDWQAVLKKHPPRDGTKISDFARCDFRPMFEYFEEEKAKKKALSSAEKKELKKQKDDAEAKYITCMLDGRKEKVGNFRVEPPGLFRGRGEHPKKGALKLRVRPEDITLNIGTNAPIPTPNVPGKWKEIIHDNTVTWLATWTENVNGNHKYVFLAPGSSLKGQSDMMKFEKARELKNHVDRIRADYEQESTSKEMFIRMRATAMYFIDKLALRAGNEKGDDEADTVGCCSLRCEHVTLEPPHWVSFDFLGKDSIRYYNRVEVTDRVFKNIKIFKKGKKDDDDLFDRVNPGLLNKHLQSYMKGLSAKVFRTYNASITFQGLLDQTPEKGTMQEKLNHYNFCNREVAVLCNHQRAVPKTHEQSMAKMAEKLRGLKYERMKLRHALFATDSKYKKNKKYSEDESDLDEDAIVEHEESLKQKEIERVEKKFAKENEKLEEDGRKPQADDVLKGRIKDVEDEYKRLTKERGTGKAELKKDKPAERLEELIDKLEDRIKTFKLQMADREAGKEVALGTSKINYLDPRITAAWCKKHDVPIEKLFSKTLVTKFPWALEVDSEWKF